jgi:hypothetical protein
MVCQMALVQQMYSHYLAEYMRYAAGEGSIAPPLQGQGQGGGGGQQGRNQGQVFNAGGGGPPALEEEQDPGRLLNHL